MFQRTCACPASSGDDEKVPLGHKSGDRCRAGTGQWIWASPAQTPGTPHGTQRSAPTPEDRQAVSKQQHIVHHQPHKMDLWCSMENGEQLQGLGCEQEASAHSLGCSTFLLLKADFYSCVHHNMQDCTFSWKSTVTLKKFLNYFLIKGSSFCSHSQLRTLL